MMPEQGLSAFQNNLVLICFNAFSSGITNYLELNLHVIHGCHDV